jgi:hypothetical protein
MKKTPQKVGAAKRMRVDTYQVQKSMYAFVDGELKKTMTLGLSPFFGSRFAAVKALRKLRRVHPTATLVHVRSEFTEQEKWARFCLLSMVVRAGQQGSRP